MATLRSAFDRSGDRLAMSELKHHSKRLSEAPTKARCPKCSGDRVGVTDSRANLDGSVIRRRRGCFICNHRWTTYEVNAESELSPAVLDDADTVLWRTMTEEDRALVRRLMRRLTGSAEPEAAP